jgi:4-aminobutyrate aminotransferase/(S)-3-amino-2-methylpropionate transaminase
MPISAITGKDEIMDASQIGGLGGTYGGNPLACAAALATIEVLEENLLDRANAIGEKIHATFKRFEKDSPYVGNVRGVGAMMAFELVEDKESKKPATDLTTKLTSYCRENKLSMITAGTYSNVVRILVPFTVSDDILERGLDIIERGLKKL